MLYDALHYRHDAFVQLVQEVKSKLLVVVSKKDLTYNADTFVKSDDIDFLSDNSL